MKLPTITTPDGRMAYAFVAIWFGCMVFTVFAAVGVWLVSGNELYTLILALAAHAQLLVGMSAFGFVLGRRVEFEVDKDGAKLNDKGSTTTATLEVKTDASS